jgi:hypothetical protein
MNKRKSGIIFTKVLLAFALSCQTQVPANAQEKIPEKFWVHFDKQFYLTGETIWYSIYNTNYYEHSDHSAIAYINFHDKEGSLIIQQKLQLVNGKAGGAFDIPVSWVEDYYYISCFTSWNLQCDNQSIFIGKIPVYNSFLAGTDNSVAHLYDDVLKQPEPQNLQISLDKSEYGTRQKVKLNIKSPIEGNCSISIISMESINDQITKSEVSLSGWYESIPLKEKEKLLSLEGFANDPVHLSPVQSEVLCLYQTGSNEFIRLSSSNSVINAEILPFFGTVKYQIFDMNPFQSETIDFRLKICGEKLLNIASNNEVPLRTNAIKNYIKNAQLRTKITEIFDHPSLDSIPEIEFSPITLKADKVYDISKFQALKTLENFFREIVTITDLTSDNGVITMRLKNMETRNYFMDRPWYLVNGFLTRDEEQVMKIPFKNLVRVEIFNTNKSILGQLDPIMIRSGMIAVYTENYSFRDLISNQNLVNFQGFSPQRKFVEVPEISKEEAREAPILSPLLYWNHNLTSNAELEIVTSDLQGDFLIEVHGYSNNGQKLYGSKIFSVKY